MAEVNRLQTNEGDNLPTEMVKGEKSVGDVTRIVTRTGNIVTRVGPNLEAAMAGVTSESHEAGGDTMPPPSTVDPRNADAYSRAVNKAGQPLRSHEVTLDSIVTVWYGGREMSMRVMDAIENGVLLPPDQHAAQYHPQPQQQQQPPQRQQPQQPQSEAPKLLSMENEGFVMNATETLGGATVSSILDRIVAGDDTSASHAEWAVALGVEPAVVAEMVGKVQTELTEQAQNATGLHGPEWDAFVTWLHSGEAPGDVMGAIREQTVSRRTGKLAKLADAFRATGKAYSEDEVGNALRASNLPDGVSVYKGHDGRWMYRQPGLHVSLRQAMAQGLVRPSRQ